jgi:hypothetical protein
METRQQRLIREALEHHGEDRQGEHEPEVSLRDQSLRHTQEDYVPRTLTPFEWEEYYRDHGVPEGHRRQPENRDRATPLRRWFARVLGVSSRRR